MITTEQLREYGANVEEGLSRCMGNEALYLRLVATIPNEMNFAKLATSLAEGDLTQAFDAAHALKGVTGNLSLTPLYDPLVEITELLRGKTDTDYSALMETINGKKDELKALCS